MSTEVNRNELESKVQAMYRDVAQNPHGEFHFEMGRALAKRLGRRPADLDRIPSEAIDSFAGVGYYFHFLDEMEGARVLDLGSGSGMDSFIASLITGPSGTVIGLDAQPGAWQIERYKRAIEDAGLRVKAEQVNEQYRFLSDNAQGATKKFGVKSISLRADRV